MIGGWVRLSSLAIGLALAGCGAGGMPTDVAAPDGLRAAAGYASYAGCGSQPRQRRECAGAAPATLRRPLHVPRVAPGGKCPVSTARTLTGFVGPLAGSGPVYPVLVPDHVSPFKFVYPPPHGGQANFAGSQWGGDKVLWVAAASYRGPVLIRGRQLDGSHAVGFGGDVVPNAELQLLAPGGSSSGEPEGWREWPSYTRLRAGGCYGYQVDGATFSSVIVFHAVPVPPTR